MTTTTASHAPGGGGGDAGQRWAAAPTRPMCPGRKGLQGDNTHQAACPGRGRAEPRIASTPHLIAAASTCCQAEGGR